MFLDMQEDSGAPYFRQMALKCRKLAASTDDPRAIDSLQRLAEEYERAAQSAAPGEALEPKGEDVPVRKLNEG